MVPVIGSGKFITTPIITDDGQPIIDSSSNKDQEGHVNSAFSENNVIQWMLVLPQIGMLMVKILILYCVDFPFPFIGF